MRSLHIEGTLNLLKAAQKVGINKWIQLSSVGVYGKCNNSKISEDTKPNPENLYEKTKLASDLMVSEFCKHAAIQYVILRPSNVVGVKMPNRSAFALIQAVKTGKFFYIGKSGSVATYVHVDDVARALIACQRSPQGCIYNLSSDCLWEKLIEQIASQVGAPMPRIRFPELPLRIVVNLLEKKIKLPLTTSRINSLTRKYGYSSEKIINELNFKFSKPMPEGICDLVAWYLKNYNNTFSHKSRNEKNFRMH